MRTVSTLLLVLTAGTAASAASNAVHYDLRVRLDPPAHAIVVEGTQGVPGAQATPFRSEKTIDHPIAREGEDYARGFAETEGTIQPQGVFLSGGSDWYPPPPEGSLVTFTLEISLPAGWDAMSQGRRTLHEVAPEGTRVRFVAEDPQEEIWLVAGPWVESRRTSDGIEALAMMRAAEDAPALAAKYLDATGPYVRMYEAMIGPYPYSKFALVENFWETGYGMPSFTVLGGTVLRLPFIVTSSYPHEILHNWWGNGVYVARDGGNWSEGLTAYLADHLLAEQKGGGAAYRQETLQKYADYVSRSRDFPLAEFKERHSPSTEAIGYGKALMLFHMTRRDVGDPAFVDGLRSFYVKNKFKRAGWADVRRALEVASGRRSIAASFDPFVARAGAPRLRLGSVEARASADGRWHVTGTILQTQEGEPYALMVPLAVTMEGRTDAQTSVVASAAAETRFDVTTSARPLRLDVDPEFDLFRMLDVEEAPPALSGAFGADVATLVLPSAAPAELVDAYRSMAGEWSKGRTSPIAIVRDDAIAELPTKGSIWVAGYENRFSGAATDALAPYGAAAVRVEKRARILVARRAAGDAAVIAFVAADHATQVPGLTRKLPHYHKYSFLAFDGDEPVNVEKGRWPVLRSPMTALLEGTPPMATLPARLPLAELPAAFSKERMLAVVQALADPGMRGRGAGTAELARATEIVARSMKEAGLEVLPADPAVPNVIGVLRGGRSDWAGQSVVVGAHYDHLGVSAEGVLHPGADDNASGVAVLLELARQMAASGPPPRSVIFAAFAGEESGLVGSKAYVAAVSPWPAAKAIGMVNLDTVGRLGSAPILVLGTATADEWIHIVNGAGYVTGAPVKAVPDDPGGSDQVAFVAAGVPAVQLFSGAHPDYHGPGDTVDRIDGDGLVRVAAVAREIVAYLAERDRPMTVRIAGAAPAAASPGGERRASLGTIPDYAFGGPGVRITGTMPDSPAAKAGLAAGDVLTKLGDAPIGSMRDFSEALKRLDPGARVVVVFVRGGETKSTEATLAPR